MSEWKPGDPIHQRPRVDLEIGACEVIDNAFGALDDAARRWVLAWAASRYAARAPVDWPARFRAAAEVAEGMYLGGLLLATAKELEENPVSAETIGRALLGEAS